MYNFHNNQNILSICERSPATNRTRMIVNSSGGQSYRPPSLNTTTFPIAEIYAIVTELKYTKYSEHFVSISKVVTEIFPVGISYTYCTVFWAFANCLQFRKRFIFCLYPKAIVLYEILCVNLFTNCIV